MEERDREIKQILVKRMRNVDDAFIRGREDPPRLEANFRIISDIIKEISILEKNCTKGKLHCSNETRVSISKYKCRMICIKVLLRTMMNIRTPKDLNIYIKDTALDLNNIFANAIYFGFSDEWEFVLYHGNNIFKLSHYKKLFENIYQQQSKQPTRMADRLTKEGEDILKIIENQIKNDKEAEE